jgi:type IV fimbrial biogenesis protein FimT
VNRNTPIRFQLTDNLSGTCALSATGTNWIVSMDNPAGGCSTAPSDTVAPRIIQLRSGTEGTPNVVVNADVTDVSFTGLGRATNAAGGSMTINVTNPTGGLCTCAAGTCGYPTGTYAANAPMRCMRIQVLAGGQVRMCDPALASTDPQGC